MLADDARAKRADDVEEADQRQRDDRIARVDAKVAYIGREMRGDEGDLEAADEEARGEQKLGAVAERLAQRLAGRLLELGGALRAGG